MPLCSTRADPSNVGIQGGKAKPGGKSECTASTKGEKSTETKPYPFFFGGFGLGPGSDVSRTSPSRRENGWLLGGGSDVGFRLVPHFFLGPIANVSSPTSSGRDSLMLGMSDVDRWFDVRGPKVCNVGISSPSRRLSGSTKTTHTQPRGTKRSATP